MAFADGLDVREKKVKGDSKDSVSNLPNGGAFC